MPARASAGGWYSTSFFGRVGRISPRNYHARKSLVSGKEWGTLRRLQTCSRILLFPAVAIGGRGSHVVVNPKHENLWTAVYRHVVKGSFTVCGQHKHFNSRQLGKYITFIIFTWQLIESLSII